MLPFNGEIENTESTTRAVSPTIAFMATVLEIAIRLDRARDALHSRKQEHVLRWWPELSVAQQEQLLNDIESIPWPAIDAVMESHIKRTPRAAIHSHLEPAKILPATCTESQRREHDEAIQTGIEILKMGKVAAFTVAGGQGTRLGVSGPKGMVAVTPVAKKSLFELFAETVLAARRRYGAAIPWYIMTSPANHQATQSFFSKNSWFGLPESEVFLFPQGTLPAFDFSGRLLMEDKHRLSLAPDGHGGSLKALAQSGSLSDMRKRGVSIISYFQVDNPLVKPFDPLFIGLHARTNSEMSTKVARKAHDLEKVGVVCVEDGKLKVIEYSEMSEDLAKEKNPDRSRRFDAANLAIHLLDVEFVERVAGSAKGLPLRRAEKAIPFLSESGERIQPNSPNAVKLETFIFDVLPMARHPLVLEVNRGEEFSPVKNASGPDSLATSQRDQVERACRWLEEAGVDVPRKPDGDCAAVVEISPLFALDVEELARKASQIPPILPDKPLYLDESI